MKYLVRKHEAARSIVLKKSRYYTQLVFSRCVPARGVTTADPIACKHSALSEIGNLVRTRK